jgi:hypothetical protein
MCTRNSKGDHVVQYRIGQYALIRLDEGECGGRVGVEGGTTYQGHEGGENEGAQHCRCRARVCGVVVVAWLEGREEGASMNRCRLEEGQARGGAECSVRVAHA